MKQFKAIVIGLALCLVIGAGVEAFASSQGQVKRQKKEAPAPKKESKPAPAKPKPAPKKEEKKPAPAKPKAAPKATPKAEPKPAPKAAPKNTPQASYSNGVLVVNGVKYEMIHVQGGTFMMGATREQQNADSDESPTHQVTLSGYWIGETEVTQALWTAVMCKTVTQIANEKGWKTWGVGDNYPMYYISWHDCQEFVRKLNALTGLHFRLPTEAEWEFAARGGTKSRGYQYSGSNNLDAVAWYDGNSGSKTHPVATKAANELGLYDMSGNVWEWCQDWKGSYSSSAQTNPTGPFSGAGRVIRGGSRDENAMDCRLANRGSIDPSARANSLGVRLAL